MDTPPSVNFLKKIRGVYLWQSFFLQVFPYIKNFPALRADLKGVSVRGGVSIRISTDVNLRNVADNSIFRVK
jgi:hypothetical protein